MAERDGKSLTGLTVNKKFVVARPEAASAAVRLMIAVPNWFVFGTRVIVRFLPLPPSVMPLADIRLVFNESAVILIWLAAISSSTLKGIAPLELSSAITKFVLIFEKVGLALVAARTRIWKVRTMLGPP